MVKQVQNEMTEVTKEIVRGCYAGDYEPWFRRLYTKSVWVSTDGPMLFGAGCIKAYFQNCRWLDNFKLRADKYLSFSISSRACIVIARVAEGKKWEKHSQNLRLLTFVYKTVGTEIKIIFQHCAAENLTVRCRERGDCSSLDIYTFRFVKKLLMDGKSSGRICVPSGGKTFFVDPHMVLYIKSSGRRTEFHCIDKIFISNLSMSDLDGRLPEHFYPIHRSYKVNVHYITAVYRYEAELICGIHVPIPALSYMQIKRNLEKRLCRCPRQLTTNM